jgi:hypothetical protein
VQLSLDDCYGDCLSLDSRDILLWWICSTDCDYVSQFEQLCTTVDRHSCVLSIDIVPVVIGDYPVG